MRMAMHSFIHTRNFKSPFGFAVFLFRKNFLSYLVFVLGLTLFMSCIIIMAGKPVVPALIFVRVSIISTLMGIFYSSLAYSEEVNISSEGIEFKNNLYSKMIRKEMIDSIQYDAQLNMIVVMAKVEGYLLKAGEIYSKTNDQLNRDIEVVKNAFPEMNVVEYEEIDEAA